MFGFKRKAKAASIKPSPVNVLGEFILPHPDDDGWSDLGMQNGAFIMTNGKVKVESWSSLYDVFVDGISLRDLVDRDAYSRYVKAVFAAKSERRTAEMRAKVLKALEETS